MLNEEQGLPQIPIEPLPALIFPNAARMANGDGAVQLYVSTPQGIQFYFIVPEYADALADALKEMAQVARTGLVVPKGSVLTSKDVTG